MVAREILKTLIKNPTSAHFCFIDLLIASLVISRGAIEGSLLYGFVTKEFAVLFVLISLYFYLIREKTLLYIFLAAQLILSILLIHTWTLLAPIPIVFGLSVFNKMKLQAFRQNIKPQFFLMLIGLLISTPLVIAQSRVASSIILEGGISPVNNIYLALVLLIWFIHIIRTKDTGLTSFLMIFSLIYFLITALTKPFALGGNGSYYPVAILWIWAITSTPILVAFLVSVFERIKQTFVKIVLLSLVTVGVYNVGDAAVLVSRINGANFGNPASIISFLQSEKIDGGSAIIYWSGDGSQQVAATIIQAVGVPTMDQRIINLEPKSICAFISNPPSKGQGHYLIDKNGYPFEALTRIYTPDTGLQAKLVEVCREDYKNVEVVIIPAPK
jgi:hypothetical protein